MTQLKKLFVGIIHHRANQCLVRNTINLLISEKTFAFSMLCYSKHTKKKKNRKKKIQFQPNYVILILNMNLNNSKNYEYEP